MATTIFLVNPQTFPVSTSYLLDTYSAAAAYSLRQLKKGVTNVVRVRRSGDNAESDFSASDITDGTLASWVTAGGGAENGFIAAWYDQVSLGVSNNQRQTTAGNQPQLVSSGSVVTKGSKPAIQFDGINDSMSNTSGGIINANDTSFFSVSYSATTASAGVVWALATNSTSTTRCFQDSRTTPNRNLLITAGSNYAADLSTARVDTNQRLLSSFIDSSLNMSAFDNGSTGGTDTYLGTPVNNAFILGRQATTSYLDGGIQEVIVFNSDESANRTDIESDINTHYSIY